MLTGLRPSEARGAAIEDLVLTGPKPGIPVRRRADKWQQIGPLKSKKARRFIPFGSKVIALLRRWLLVVPRGEGFPNPERPGEMLHPLFRMGIRASR
jgi:integrase